MNMVAAVKSVQFQPARSLYTCFGKRCLDLAISIPALVLLAPVLLVLAALVWTHLGTPVLFRQERVGLGERVFRLLKFRSMTNARDRDGKLLPDGERLTRLGLFLRRWSLDELPQFFNVLRGDLSLVGPRPLLIRYLPRYTQRQRQRHYGRPGITGWAQVNGRNLLAWEARFEHDVWYLEHCSLGLDLKILLLTARRLLGNDDTLAAAGRELEEFWGTAVPPRDGPRAFPVDETEVLPNHINGPMC